MRLKTMKKPGIVEMVLTAALLCLPACGDTTDDAAGTQDGSDSETCESSTTADCDTDVEQSCHYGENWTGAECLCVKTQINENSPLLVLDFFGPDSSWYETCTNFIQLTRLDDNGAYVAVQNSVSGNCYSGCYVDGEFFPPNCDEGCDILDLQPLQNEQFQVPLVHYEQVGTQEAPDGVELCDWFVGEDTDSKPTFPVYEKRNIAGQMRVEVDYFSRDDCEPIDDRWDESVVSRTAAYDFSFELPDK